MKKIRSFETSATTFKIRRHHNPEDNIVKLTAGLVRPQAISRGPSPRSPGFTPGSVHVGFVVDKMEIGQIFSEFFG
jgi:hypothetical protein